MKIGLQTRLLASLVFLVIVTLAILGGVLLFDSERKLEAFQLTQAQYQARTLAEGSLDALVSKDFEQLERLVASALPSADFAYAALVKPNGQVLTHSDMSFIGNDVQTSATSDSTTIHDIVYQSRPVREVIAPAMVGKSHFANAHVAYFLDARSLVADDSLPWIGLALMLSIIILSTGCYLITRRVIHPIEQLTDIVSCVSFDELEYKQNSDNRIHEQLQVYSKRNDQIGILYQVFDNAISRLSHSYLDLHQSKSDLLKRTNALSVAKVQAEQANIAKSAFLANMSHELRTPLTAIIGYSEELLDDELSKQEQVSSIDTIIHSGRHLLEIISSILDLSKIEAERFEIEYARFNLFQLMMDINAIMQIQAKSKEIDFEIHFQYPLPETIESDTVRLKQILINLCDNAIKFTHKGSVTVEVSCNRENTEISFSVIDTGIGMNNEQKAKIFDAFVQADVSTTRKYGGTGLGLHLSKRLAEILGGDINVQSDLDMGSQFNLVIQSGDLNAIPFLTNAPAHDIELNVLEGHHNCNLTGHVLLVEDNKANQNLICKYIKRAGPTATIVENGKIAVETAMSQSFDLILMDIQMPVMGGLEALQILRNQGYAGSIVALTANSMAYDKQIYIDAGFDAYLPKPIEREQFFQLLRDRLGPPTESASSTKPTRHNTPHQATG